MIVQLIIIIINTFNAILHYYYYYYYYYWAKNVHVGQCLALSFENCNLYLEFMSPQYHRISTTSNVHNKPEAKHNTCIFFIRANIPQNVQYISYLVWNTMMSMQCLRENDIWQKFLSKKIASNERARFWKMRFMTRMGSERCCVNTNAVRETPKTEW